MLVEAGSGRVLLRGARKRCPRCGARGIWLTWFKPKPLCPVCDLRFEAEDGGFLGAMVLNYTFACSFWIAAMVVTMILTVPFIPVVPVIMGSIVILGGISVWGGKGSILGVVLASLVFGLVTFGLGLMNIPGIVMSIFTGALLIIVVALPALVQRR